MNDLLPSRIRDEHVAVLEVVFEYSEEPKDPDFWSDMMHLFTRSHSECSNKKLFVGHLRIQEPDDRRIGYMIEDVQERLDRYWPKTMRSPLISFKVFDVLVGLRMQSK